jgi:hypothetical protein
MLDSIGEQRPGPGLKRKLAELGFGGKERIAGFTSIGSEESKVLDFIRPCQRLRCGPHFPKTFLARNRTKVHASIRPMRCGSRRCRCTTLAASTATTLAATATPALRQSYGGGQDYENRNIKKLFHDVSFHGLLSWQ